MIKGINSSGRYLTVTGGGVCPNYINNYSGAQGVGNIRFNTTNQNTEVFDGNNWQTLSSSYATVQLSSEAEELLDWARKQRDREKELSVLAKTHPAIANAVNNVKQAEDALEIIRILNKKEYDTETTS